MFSGAVELCLVVDLFGFPFLPKLCYFLSIWYLPNALVTDRYVNTVLVARPPESGRSFSI